MPIPSTDACAYSIRAWLPLGESRVTQEQISFLESLYRKHYDLMYEVALRIVKNPAKASDVVSETFLILILKISAVMNHEDPVKWLFTVLKNTALSEYRKSKVRKEISLDDAMIRGTEQEMIPFSEMLPKGLTAEEREILTLRLGEDLDYAEIAKRLHATESACRMKFSRARKRCAELLEQDA